MKLKKEQLDKIAVIIQGVLAVVFVIVSIKNENKKQQADGKKISKLSTKQQAKLLKVQFKNDKKQLKKRLKAQ